MIPPFIPAFKFPKTIGLNQMQNSNQEIQSTMTQSKTSTIIDSLIFNTYRQTIKWWQMTSNFVPSNMETGCKKTWSSMVDPLNGFMGVAHFIYEKMIWLSWIWVWAKEWSHHEQHWWSTTPTMTPQPSRVHLNNPKSQIDNHQNTNRNLHVTLLKTQTQISHAPPPQIKTQIRGGLRSINGMNHGWVKCQKWNHKWVS